MEHLRTWLPADADAGVRYAQLSECVRGPQHWEWTSANSGVRQREHSWRLPLQRRQLKRTPAVGRRWSLRKHTGNAGKPERNRNQHNRLDHAKDNVARRCTVSGHRKGLRVYDARERRFPLLPVRKRLRKLVEQNRQRASRTRLRKWTRNVDHLMALQLRDSEVYFYRC